MKRIDPAAVLRDALQVLSRAEVEKAWAAAEATNRFLGGNVAQRAEMAAYVLATILADVGSTSKRDDLAGVAAAVEALAIYVCGRMTVIVTELGGGNADARSFKAPAMPSRSCRSCRSWARRFVGGAFRFLRLSVGLFVLGQVIDNGRL